VILVTGRVFDVLDVPAEAGQSALARMDRSGVRLGPVAITAGDRFQFYVRTRGNPADENEWWSCHLDSEPQEVAGGLRWHCRASYVLAPPGRSGSGTTARWIRSPEGRELPDCVPVLEVLADACEGAG
jgi:Bifunctional DNA primase/polymerase, N-terminal